MIKDADEIALLRLAAQAADRVVAQIAAGRLVGRTEADVAREVRERLIAEGHDDGASSRSSAPARTRRRPTTRRRSGSSRPASRSSSTSAARSAATAPTSRGRCGSPAATRRTGPDEAFRHLFDVLLRRAGGGDARRSGRASPARRSTRAARGSIDAEGYGEAFFHRTGHGIGLEGHEDPYLVAGNDAAAARRAWRSASSPGSTSSGEYGARIEDIVVCGPDGPIVLNEAPRELYVVDG